MPTTLSIFEPAQGAPARDATAEGCRVAKKRRDVPKHDARLGIVGDAANGPPKVVPVVEDGFAVPIVMAGGKKLPELDALTMANNAVSQGAAGVDMGRNIFQSAAPKAMLAAVNAVVHELIPPKQAYELYREMKASRA